MEVDGCKIDNERSLIDIFFTPTIPHCSMCAPPARPHIIGSSRRAVRLTALRLFAKHALTGCGACLRPRSTLIGLCIRVKLLRSLPSRFKVDVRVTPGSHKSEHEVPPPRPTAPPPDSPPVVPAFLVAEACRPPHFCVAPRSAGQQAAERQGAGAF